MIRQYFLSEYFHVYYVIVLQNHPYPQFFTKESDVTLNLKQEFVVKLLNVR